MTWQDSAACAGADPELFFPEGREQLTDAVEAARRYCAVCPTLVREACAADAVSNGDYGIRAGVLRHRHRQTGPWQIIPLLADERAGAA